MKNMTENNHTVVGNCLSLQDFTFFARSFPLVVYNIKSMHFLGIKAILCFKLHFATQQLVMVLLTWIVLIKFTKEPGKLFRHSSCCYNYFQSAARAHTNSDRPHP